MKETISQCVIIGGGSSISEGLSKGLWDKLKDHFVIGINYSYHYFNATFQCYLDRTFYQKNRNDLIKLPLIITKPHKTTEGVLPTAIIMPTYTKYNRDLKAGIFKGSLTGIYSLSLAIYLLDKGEIFLLGYDYGGQGEDNKGKAITHYYQGKLEHKGVGKINYYNNKNRADRDFGVFKDEQKIKIINVSPLSKINTFEKIDYKEFFKRLDKNTFNQDILREEIRRKLEGIKK